MKTNSRNPHIAKLVDEIASYQAQNAMSDTAFGTWAVNDPNLLRDIKRGRDLRWATIQTIRAKMAGGKQ